jgi:asparagine synthase (glutamine-hydrolysing)
MCGIAGLRTLSHESNEPRLSRMLHSMRYRGPDGEGQTESADWRIGAVRLSVIDVKTGNQPFTSADGRWILVLNGEIYNYGELRTALAEAGAHFKSSSDTEVLVELIARHGILKSLELIEGMFGFAAVDARAGDLWLVRDRFGEKPLFIDRRNQSFAFSSELTPLMITGGITPRPSVTGVVSVLRFGYPWPGSSAVDGIDELRPGQWLKRAATGHEMSGFYWKLPSQIDEQAGPTKRCEQKFLDLLTQSVTQRVTADVPLGLFLSGGLDSAAVAEAASHLKPKLSAVTMGFTQGGYDERPLARSTASTLGLSLHEALSDQQGFSPALVDDLLLHYGQPFGDTSAIPTRELARAARPHFKVALSGDGGDELLGGYLSFQRLRQLQMFGGGVLGGLGSGYLLGAMPSSEKWESGRRAMRLNASLHAGLYGYAFDGVFDDSQILALLKDTPWEILGRENLAAFRQEAAGLWAQAKDPLLALSSHLLSRSLPQDMLMKMDRMSMAESLEVRAPFLDSRLATFALSLPAHLKMPWMTGKVLIRKALEGRLPESVLTSPKRGFELPLREWLGPTFRTELNSEIASYKSDPAAELNLHELERLVLQEERRSRNGASYRSAHRVWLIYVFLRWRRIWCSSSIYGSTAAYA